MKKQSQATSALLFAVVAGCALLLGTTLPLRTQAEALPPRPTLEPTPTPTPLSQPGKSDHVDGGLIVLELQTGPATLSELEHWRDIWTVVQWQDGLGGWHDVTGWRGNLDAMDDYVGWKVWWVEEDDFGTGPFRWVVYRRRDGEALAHSESFHLPERADEIVTVEVTLTP